MLAYAPCLAIAGRVVDGILICLLEVAAPLLATD
jgi:hypothetical protein